MDPSCGNWPIILSSLAILGAGLLPTCACGGADTDLAEIVERQLDWQNSIVTLRVVWEKKNLQTDRKTPLPEWTAAVDSTNSRLMSRGEWIWSHRGFALMENRSFLRDGRERRLLEGHNGVKRAAFHAEYESQADGPEQLLIVERTPEGIRSEPFPGPGFRNGEFPGLIAGNRLHRDPEWTLEGTDELGGDRCARIVQKVGDSFETLWVDLEHDCLVRRRLGAVYSGDDTGRVDEIVDEFQQLGDGRWFPKRGRIQVPSAPYENHVWDVVEVEINEPFDLRRFERLESTTEAPGHRRAGEQTGTDASPNAAATSNGQSASKPNRKPTQGWSGWPAFFIGGLLFLLAAGFWFSRRK